MENSDHKFVRLSEKPGAILSHVYVDERILSARAKAHELVEYVQPDITLALITDLEAQVNKIPDSGHKQHILKSLTSIRGSLSRSLSRLKEVVVEIEALKQD